MKELKTLSAILLAISFTACHNQQPIKPSRKNIVEAVFASGNITTQNQYVIASQADGYLLNTFFNEGDSINKGQTVFRLENEAQTDQLFNAEANYQYALSNAESRSPVLEQLMAQKAKSKTNSLPTP